MPIRRLRTCPGAFLLLLGSLGFACGGGATTGPVGDDGKAAGPNASDAASALSPNANRPGTKEATDPELARPAAPSSRDVSELPSDWVFDDAELRSYELTLDPEVWESLQRNARDEQYAEADLRIDDISVTRIGLRFKGSVGTLAACFADDGRPLCSKLSMKLKFDEYLPDQRFFGLKRLNFNSMVLDPSLLHERLAYRLFRELGVVAPRAVHATLSVNGEALGVFSLVEGVDGRFTDDHFAGGDGNLYKEAWPDTDDMSQRTTHESCLPPPTPLPGTKPGSDPEL